MKVFIVVCLAVSALAESDPQLIYSSPLITSLVSPWNVAPAVAVAPVTYVKPVEAEAKPVVEEKKAPAVESYKAEEEKAIKTPVATPLVYTTAGILPVQTIQVAPRYVAKNGDVEHIVAKREAEADPQLLAYNLGLNPLVYSAPYVYNTAAVHPVLGFRPKTYANNNLPGTQDYAAKGQYVADSVGARHVAKREAEADPQLLTYNLGVNPVVYSTPLAYNTAVVNPAVVNPVAGVRAKTYANNNLPWTQYYAAKGQYVADSVGARHVAKREAEGEAEADPALLLYNTPLRTTFYTRPYVHSTGVYTYPVARPVFF